MINNIQNSINIIQNIFFIVIFIIGNIFYKYVLLRICCFILLFMQEVKLI